MRTPFSGAVAIMLIVEHSGQRRTRASQDFSMGGTACEQAADSARSAEFAQGFGGAAPDGVQGRSPPENFCQNTG